MVNLIGFAGGQGSGKDTAAKYFKELCGDKEWEVKKFATNLKIMTAILLNCTVEDLEDRKFKDNFLGEEWDCYRTKNYNGETLYASLKEAQKNENNLTIQRKSLTPREVMRKLGTDFGRDMIHPEVWVRSLFSGYVAEKSKWLITDVRFPNEVNAIKIRGGVVVNIVNSSSNNFYNHKSETSLGDHTEFDFIIDNSTTFRNLETQVKKLIDCLKGKNADSFKFDNKRLL